MEITKVVKPFIRRGANTFGNIVYIYIIKCIYIYIYIKGNTTICSLNEAHYALNDQHFEVQYYSKKQSQEDIQ